MPIRVEYHSSWSRGAVRLLVWFWLSGFLGFIVGAFWWAGLLRNTTRNLLLDLIGIAIIGFVALMVGWLLGRSYPSRLVITEHDVALGSRIFKRRIPHDAISLIEIDREALTVSKHAVIRLQTRWRRHSSGPLRELDALEAWEALRALNPNALGRYFADDETDTVYLPDSPEGSDPLRLREALLTSVRARRWRAGLATTGGAVITIGATVGLVFFRQSLSTSGTWRAWMWVVIGPLVLFGAGRVFLAAHGRLRALLAMPPEELEASLRAAQEDDSRSDQGAPG